MKQFVYLWMKRILPLTIAAMAVFSLSTLPADAGWGWWKKFKKSEQCGR